MEVTVYSGGIGINNKITSHRLLFDLESGVGAFEDAENVVIDPTGKVTACRGTNLNESGDYHSVFAAHKYWGLVALNRTNDAAIYRVDVDNSGSTTLTGIGSGFSKYKFDFCKVIDEVYYTNGFEHGRVLNGNTIADWKVSTWPDDRTIANFITPPVSDHLAFFAGRIFFSIDNIIYYTEYGHPGIYNSAINGEQFPSKILMIIPTIDGIYISDEENIYYLSGLNPHKWNIHEVCNYPAIEWGVGNKINPRYIGFDSTIPSTIIATVKGPEVCLPAGNIENLIDKNITMPSCPNNGAILVVDESLIIQTGE